MKAQGALEYLLLIGGAILIAAIIITIMSSNTSNQEDTIKQNTLSGKCAVLTENFCSDPTYADFEDSHTGVDCEWNQTKNKCIPNCKFSDGSCN